MMQSILLQFLHAESSRQRLGHTYEWRSTSSGEGTDPQQARLLLDVSLRPLIGVLMVVVFFAVGAGLQSLDPAAATLWQVIR